MSKLIYQLFVGQTNTASNLAWSGLSEEKQKAFMAEEQASRDAVGAKMIVVCESGWADETHPFWGIHSFPDLQARIEHTRKLQQIGWLDITEAFTLLGVSEEDKEPVLPDFPNPIYMLWIEQAFPASYANRERLSKEEADGLLGKMRESKTRVGGCEVLMCDSFWSNQENPSFGVDAFPSVEALQEYARDLQGLNWGKYITAFTLLGTAMG